MNFELGTFYVRKDVHDIIGGGERETFLPQKDGRVVAAFVDSTTNPGAPETLQVGKGVGMIAKSQLLAKQEEPIPIFRKGNVGGANVGKYEYVGTYQCVGIDEDAESIAAEEARSGRIGTVSMVIRMKYVKS